MSGHIMSFPERTHVLSCDDDNVIIILIGLHFYAAPRWCAGTFGAHCGCQLCSRPAIPPPPQTSTPIPETLTVTLCHCDTVTL